MTLSSMIPMLSKKRATGQNTYGLAPGVSVGHMRNKTEEAVFGKKKGALID